jgi:hypothetical protein
MLHRNSCPSPLQPSAVSMSDPSAFQDPPTSMDVISAGNSSNNPGLSSSSSALLSQPDSPDASQEISYFPSNSAISSPLQNRKNDHSQPSGASPKRPCGPCYTRDELFHLKKSPLVAPPAGMPARKDWFGYVFIHSLVEPALNVDP